MKFRISGVWILILALNSFVISPVFAVDGLNRSSNVCKELKNQLYREQAIVNELIKQAKKDSRAYVSGTGSTGTASSAVKTYLVSEINMIKIASNKSSCFTPAKVAAVRTRLTQTTELYKLFVKADSNNNSTVMKPVFKAFSNLDSSNFAKLLYQE